MWCGPPPLVVLRMPKRKQPEAPTTTFNANTMNNYFAAAPAAPAAADDARPAHLFATNAERRHKTTVTKCGKPCSVYVSDACRDGTLRGGCYNTCKNQWVGIERFAPADDSLAAAAAFRAPLDLTKSQKLKARGKHRAVREERAPQPPALGASVTLRAFKHKTNLNGQRGVVVGFDDGLLASDDSRLAAAAAAEPAERCTVRLEDGRRVKNLKVRNLERRSPRHKSYCSGWSALPPQPPWEPTVELQVRRRILEHQHARTSGSHREEVLRAVRRHRGVKDLRHPTDPASTSASKRACLRTHTDKVSNRGAIVMALSSCRTCAGGAPPPARRARSHSRSLASAALTFSLLQCLSAEESAATSQPVAPEMRRASCE